MRDHGAVLLTAYLLLQRFLTDTAKPSEFFRAHDVDWTQTLESRGRWLAGDIKLPDASSAEDSIRRKATLVSADDDCLRTEVQTTRYRSLQNIAQLKQQGRAARGGMLHKSFPALPSASTALAGTCFTVDVSRSLRDSILCSEAGRANKLNQTNPCSVCAHTR